MGLVYPGYRPSGRSAARNLAGWLHRHRRHHQLRLVRADCGPHVHPLRRPAAHPGRGQVAPQSRHRPAPLKVCYSCQLLELKIMARSVNKVTLLGNVGKDPEIRSTPSGVMVASFGLATSDRFQDAQGNWQDRTEWHNLKAFKRTDSQLRPASACRPRRRRAICRNLRRRHPVLKVDLYSCVH